MLYSFRLYYIQFKEVKILWGPRARGLGPIVECEGRITQRPLVNTQNSQCMQGILLQIRYFERELSNSFKKDNFIFLSNRMSSVCPSHVIHMSLVCTRMSSVSHSYVLVCHSYVTRMYSYVIRMSLVCGFAMSLLFCSLKTFQVDFKHWNVSCRDLVYNLFR